jgi:hypothetical protein
MNAAPTMPSVHPFAVIEGESMTDKKLAVALRAAIGAWLAEMLWLHDDAGQPGRAATVQAVEDIPMTDKQDVLAEAAGLLSSAGYVLKTSVRCTCLGHGSIQRAADGTVRAESGISHKCSRCLLLEQIDAFQAAQAASSHESARAQPASEAGEMAVAERLCKIYFEIAAECVGEDEVRRRRDERIAAIDDPSQPETAQEGEG